MPNTTRPHVSPFEVCFGKRPDLSHLRVFGSRGFVQAYRVWDLETERVLTTRTVVLNENSSASYSELPPRADNTLQVAQLIHFDDDVVRSGPQSPSQSTNEDIEMTSSEPDGILAVNDCAEDMGVDE
ncbi:unnamed protein product [Phytophthora fragariaefolia]|uniref:Unnamed protein product n=1 Tax=Phytophthora fragariaefolia TaxID=1490495 RepID=A0A9W7CU44_9STRA|nr:unnamed protein product [Phytophthora fragariaefolia]